MVQVNDAFQREVGVASVFLFAANAASALVSFVTNLYLARTLGPVEFGKYAFTIAILAFLSFFFDLGYFASGARLLVLVENEKEKKGYYGALFMIGGVISVVFIFAVLGLSQVTDFIFTDRIGRILSGIAWVSPALIAPMMVEQVLKASDRIYLLGAWNLLGKVFFVAALWAVNLLGELTALNASLCYGVAGMVGVAGVTLVLQPKWRGTLSYRREIVAEQRRFGRVLYVGKTANLVSYKTDSPLLAYFSGATSVGFYALAMSVASVVPLFSHAVATFAFRRFARLRPVSGEIKMWNLAGIVICSAAVLLGTHYLVLWYLGPSYSSVDLLVFPAVAANALQAAYQPYNSWLLANGLGTELRQITMVGAAFNLLANLVLIPSWGAFGAALASAIGMMAYLVLTLHHYEQRLLAAS